MTIRLIIFLVLNFGALAIGGLSTNSAVTADWYVNLNKAPWTPPGWVFGATWTLIMILFSIYLAYLWPTMENKKLLLTLFSLQWVLNVIWNPIFFQYHNMLAGLVVITALTVLMGVILFYFLPVMKNKSLLIAPYLIWLLIATSLNGYALFNN